MAASNAHASSLIVNGDFNTPTAVVGQLGTFANVPGWSSTGFNILYGATGADFPGAPANLGAPGLNGMIKLWGPANGANNGLTASPTGGNFIALDGAFQVGPLTQTINSLVAGMNYVLTFNWAGAQQFGRNGATTEQFAVSLGNQTLFTPVLHDSSHGFTGWHTQQMTFTATSGSELLKFLAVGTPNGLPPFSLLDSVSMKQVAVPEPASWALMLCGFGLVGTALRRRQQQAKLATA